MMEDWVRFVTEYKRRNALGSYAECWLDDLHIGSSKNDVDSELMALFRPSDKVIHSGPMKPLPAYFERYSEYLAEDSNEKLIFYRANARSIRDRLDLLGYTLDTAKIAFLRWTQIAIEEEAGYLDDPTFSSEEIKTWGLRKIELLRKLTPDIWLSNLLNIRASGLKPNAYGCYEAPFDDSIQGYMLANGWHGFPGYDVLVPLRLAVEACGDNSFLVYELTDLIISGYFDLDHEFVEAEIGHFTRDYGSRAKTIVLTEGKSDAWVLKESMKILYPHLCDYFSFLDFEGTGYGGGVGNLANVVKAFSGAGIANRVIGLFDNDTAAAAALKSIDDQIFPENIVICCLPEIDLLRAYPTIGPSGESKLNVNGVAASIELYMGEDVLQGADGALVPVQWTGFERAVKQYQGEVMDKAILHTKFRRKISEAETPYGPEWNDLRAVFEHLFSAFQTLDRDIICTLPETIWGY